MSRSIMIVDDNAFIRYQLRRVFDGQSGFHVCAEAKDGREAIETAERILPDMMILDLAMPAMNGLDAARTLKKSMHFIQQSREHFSRA